MNYDLKNKLKTKSRSAFSRIVFSKTIIIILLLIIQILFVLVAAFWLSKYATILYGINILLSIVLLVYIVNNKSNPAFKLAWVLPIAAFPVVGLFLYFFIMFNIGGKAFERRTYEIRKQTDEFSHTESNVKKAIHSSDVLGVSDYLDTISNNPSYKNSDVKYFKSGEDMFSDLIEELKKAEHFVFLEYFIIKEGKMWDSILEILVDKAQAGIEVRVMFDGTSVLTLLPGDYAEKLKSVGLQAKIFSPFIPLFSTHQNNRDHRKIFDIDGRVVYNGGVNLADEYINEVHPYGYYKDTAVKVSGDAVKGFTKMFLEMWNIDETIDEDYKKYIKDPFYPIMPNDSIVIPYGDEPTIEHNIAENVYMDILYKAKKYVYIMTPYFIVDNEMLRAITFAAERGIIVKLLFPKISDSWAVNAIMKTYYPLLIEAGVEIYEFTPGFVHSKLFVSDDIKAVVGSINLDFRSLYHHFECATYMYNCRAIKDIKQDFINTVSSSERMTINKYKKLPIFQRIIGKVLKGFGILM